MAIIDNDVFKEIPLTPPSDDITEVELKAGRSHFYFCRPKHAITVQPNRQVKSDQPKIQVS